MLPSEIMDVICERLRQSVLWHGVHYDVPIDTLWERGTIPRVGVWDFGERFDLAATGHWFNELDVRIAVAFGFSDDDTQRTPRRVAHRMQHELERQLTPVGGKLNVGSAEFDILPTEWVIQEIIEDAPEHVGLLWSSWEVRYHRAIAA